MATVTFHGAGADMMFGAIFEAQYYGVKSSTLFEVLGKYGSPLQVFYGTNFTYSGFVSGGNIARYDLFNADGSLASVWAGMNVTASQYNSATRVGGGLEALHELILRGNDTIVGTGFNDRLRASAGNDVINGGGGVDIFSAADLGAVVMIDLATGVASSGLGTTRLTSIEGVEGSTRSDILRGNNLANTLQGFGGDDVLDGRAGIDTVIYRDATAAVTVNLATGKSTGGSGADTLISIENVVGSRFNDTITGNAGNNVLDGFLGNDRIDGGAGVDTVDYRSAYNGVSVNLASGGATGAFGTDTLLGIENVFGSNFNDRLTGGATANVLQGLNGNDVLSGGAGNDALAGGAGNDVFVFNSALNAATNRDTITDFLAINDTIQLENAIFTKLTRTGALADANFKLGAAAADANDHIVYNRTTGALYYDADGNGAGVAVHFATLSTKPVVTAADFFVI